MRKDAVHSARLRVGQGLVGRIAERAEPFNTDDAQTAPGFRYLPETGEEIYHSFVGVPIQRLGEVMGVLVVQNEARRNYAEDEVEAAIDAHPSVHSSVVIGLPDDELGQKLHALVEARPSVPVDELREFLEADLVEVRADPEFKERLRRRLWEMVQARSGAARRRGVR